MRRLGPCAAVRLWAVGPSVWLLQGSQGHRRRRCTAWLSVWPTRPQPPNLAPPRRYRLQLPAGFFLELEYRAAPAPGASQPPGEWLRMEVAGGGMDVQVLALEPGTKYAFR